MTDQELTEAIRRAHEDLMRAVEAAREAGLYVKAEFVERLPRTGMWALMMDITRTVFLAESDGQLWVEQNWTQQQRAWATRPGLHGETGGAEHGATGA